MTPELCAQAILALFILSVAYVSWFIAIPWLIRELITLWKEEQVYKKTGEYPIRRRKE